MKCIRMQWVALGLLLGGVLPLNAKAATAGPVALRVDDLAAPLGIDDPDPYFSWQLKDPAQGAKQTGYEVLVASRAELLQQGQADVWDSGRIESSQSLNVRYGGPAVSASTRYFWCVKIWDEEGKAYPESEINWWETGLLKPAGWNADWIGYETPEESAVRNAPAVWIASPDARAVAGEKEQGAAFCLSAARDSTEACAPSVALRHRAGSCFTLDRRWAGAAAEKLPPW